MSESGAVVIDGILRDVGEVHGILWGRIFDDRKKRFPDGTDMHTSRVVRRDGNVFFTKNSIYLVESWADGCAPEDWPDQ